MLPEETNEEYVMRCDNIYNCLKGNGTLILPYQVIAALVKGLPGELEGAEMALLANVSGRSLPDVLSILTGVAYSMGFNDCLPTGDMDAKTFTPGTSSQTPSRSRPTKIWWT